MEVELLVNKFYSKHPLKKLTIDSKTLEYLVAGQGKETFLIFPGVGQSAQSNFNLVLNIEDQYKVVSLNVYEVNSINEYCALINKILDKEKVGKVILYGLSLGGLLVQSYLRRNKERVSKIIISHGCAPSSLSLKKIVIHLRILNLILPFLPDFLIKTGFKKIVKGLQLGEKQFIGDYVPDLDPELLLLHKYFSKEFFKKCLTKTLLKTEIRLVNDFYENEKFKVEDLRDWQGKILILRTNNDPLANDDGQFKILYPNAEVYTFNNTGHLTFYYQFDKMVKIIRGFLKKKLTLSKTDPHLHLNLNICSGWKISIIHTRRGQPSKKIISTCYRWSQPGQGLDKLINN